MSADCDHGCATVAACLGHCGKLPERLLYMPSREFSELLDFANGVQKWSLRVKGDATFGRAAERFKVPVERIADAVTAHYWMFTHDTDRPLAERRIEHDGE